MNKKGSSSGPSVPLLSSSVVDIAAQESGALSTGVTGEGGGGGGIYMYHINAVARPFGT